MTYIPVFFLIKICQINHQENLWEVVHPVIIVAMVTLPQVPEDLYFLAQANHLIASWNESPFSEMLFGPKRKATM